MNRAERYSKRAQPWTCKRPRPWIWAYNHSNRVTKHWNWRLVTAMNGVEHHSCVPFALYKWKAFGFDGRQKPVWTIADYINGGVR